MINIITAINILGVTALLGLVGYWFYKKIKKKYKKIKPEDNIPKELLEDFEILERRLKESNGNKTAEQILWEFTRERSERAAARTADISGRTEDTGIRRTSYAKLPTIENLRGDRELVRGKDIQIQSNPGNTKEQPSTREDKRKSKIDWTNFS
jgi:hypothetical protein